MKMRLMGVAGPTEVQPLREEKAVELGAEIIGEAFLYSIAASFLMFEYYRGVRKEQKKDDSQDSQILRLGDRLKELDKEMREVKTKIDGLEKNISNKPVPASKT